MAEIADLGHVYVRELAASDWEGLNSWIRMLTCSAGLPPPALIHNVLVTLPELLWKEKTLHRFIRMLTFPARPRAPGLNIATGLGDDHNVGFCFFPRGPLRHHT